MDSDKDSKLEDEPKEQPSLEETDEKKDDDKSTPVEHSEKIDMPADALSRTPDELEEAAAEIASEEDKATEEKATKKPSALMRFLRKANVYILLFVLLLVIAGAVTLVYYFNSQQPDPEIAIANQELTEEALQQLANSDATVGNAATTLNIQGNAIIAGQTLMRGNLNVAGNIQSGGSIQGPTLTISGSSNLGDTQINSLQVATNLAIEGNTTMRELNVSGASTLGPVTAAQITTSRLILSGNAILEVPNHLRFTGVTPGRSVESAVGNGGTVSVGGSDTSGSVTINTGNNTQPGCFTRISFNQAYSAQPRVIITPIGRAAGQTNFYVDRNNTGFSICTANAAPANQSFGFDYFVAG